MICIRPGYLLFALLVFILEVIIACYVRDALIRPYGGDFLVVILIYTFLRGLLCAAPGRIALFTLAFSFAVEAGQYFRLVERLGLSGNRTAEVVIGTGFDVGDLLAYTLGTAMAWLVDRAA